MPSRTRDDPLVEERPLELPDGGLTDGVVTVSPPREEDAEALAAGARDAAVARFANVSWADATIEELRERIRGAWRERAAEGALAHFAIRDAGSLESIGYLIFFGVNLRDGRAEVGYFVFPEARGRGAATRATMLVVDWAFHDLGLQRVQAIAFQDNVASQRVIEKAGFTREGVLRSYFPRPEGGRGDAVIFSRLATD